MASHIGYPPELIDKSQLEKLHIGLKMKPNEHFKNKYRASVFNAGLQFKQLREPVDKMSWKDTVIQRTSVAKIEAWYHPAYNAMSIPAAVLRGVSEDLPMYTNYATLGDIVGHEITHGFDNLGRNFNSEGNLEDWWDAESEDK